MGRRISDEIRSKIAEDYLKGESSIQLSEKYGINKTTVCDILKEKGIKVRPYNFSRNIVLTNIILMKQTLKKKPIFLDCILQMDVIYMKGMRCLQN